MSNVSESIRILQSKGLNVKVVDSKNSQYLITIHGESKPMNESELVQLASTYSNLYS
ncbi:hypothetical protein LIS04_93 [Listeria phage LIS04]|nr:hypothetical protein LIS04_93 [Listeria phage LIS04]